MPAPSLEWAQNAMQHVRDHRVWGSSNKRRPGIAVKGCQPGMDRMERLKQAEVQKGLLNEAVDLVGKLWNNPNLIKILKAKYSTKDYYQQLLTACEQTHGAGKRSLEDYARALVLLGQQLGVGNCDDFAFAAYVYLIDNDVRPVAAGGLMDGDHGFAILGRNCQSRDVIDEPVDKWGDQVWICDPWANIACAAADYHNQWQLKMQKWSQRGTEVDTEKGWIDPKGEDWISCIVRHKINIVFASS